jgi:hypothetical protein
MGYGSLRAVPNKGTLYERWEGKSFQKMPDDATTDSLEPPMADQCADADEVDEPPSKKAKGLSSLIAAIQAQKKGSDDAAPISFRKIALRSDLPGLTLCGMGWNHVICHVIEPILFLCQQSPLLSTWRIAPVS